MASKTVRAPESQIDYGQVRLYTFLRLSASLVVGGSLLLVTGLFTERGFDKITVGLMMGFVTLFLIGLTWWWQGNVLYKKLVPHLSEQERLLWQGASNRDMRRLLTSINAGEKRLRSEAQGLYQMASAFPGLQDSKDFKRAVRSLNIRTCEQMIRVEEIGRRNAERATRRRTMKESATGGLVSDLQKLGVSQKVIERAAPLGRRELQALMQGALHRKGLLTQAKELGIESLALRYPGEGEGYTNVPLMVLVDRVKEMKDKALSYGIHVAVSSSLGEGDIEKATKLLTDHESRLQRELEVKKLSEIAQTLPSEQIDGFHAALTQLRGLLENPKEFRVAAHEMSKTFSRR